MKLNRKQQCYAAFEKFDGLPVTKIAKKTGIPSATLYKWRKQWLAEKTTPVKKKPPVAKKVMELVELEKAGDEALQALGEAVNQKPLAVDVSKHCGSVAWAVVVGFILGVVFMFVVGQL